MNDESGLTDLICVTQSVTSVNNNDILGKDSSKPVRSTGDHSITRQTTYSSTSLPRVRSTQNGITNLQDSVHISPVRRSTIPQASEMPSLAEETEGQSEPEVHKSPEKVIDVRINEAYKASEDTNQTVDQNSNEKMILTTHQRPRHRKKIRKGIFVSYSPDAGFTERCFVTDLIRQLKENNMAEDIWFDKDENNIDSPVWFSQRMEAVERCQAAIVILSDTYFTCPVSVYEGRTLLERSLKDPHSVRIFIVCYSTLADSPEDYSPFLQDMVDLSTPAHSKLSIAERSSVVMGAIMEELEKYAVINMPSNFVNDTEPEFDGEYKTKVSTGTSLFDVI